MARTRSILMDNSLGRIFSGLSQVLLQATNANVIGGAISQIKSISPVSMKATVVPALNLGYGTTIGPNGGLITRIAAQAVSGVPVGANLSVTIKTGALYSNSTVATTLTILNKTSSATFVGSINVPAGHNIYVDVSYAGTPSTRAIGLTIAFSYFPTAI